MTSSPLFAGADQVPAPDSWRSVGFLSDTHFHEEDPATLAAVLATVARPEVDAWFFLGDLFEVWVGHDCLQDPLGYETRCVAQLREALAGRPAFFLHGNRDFLVTQACAAQMGATLVSDPCVLTFRGERWLLTHGDGACIADRDYQRFRAMVRGQPWQTQFLGQPLAARREMARALREQSRASQQAQHASQGQYSDVDEAFMAQSLMAHGASRVIHGHTHRPAHLSLPHGERWVLSDWSAADGRGDWLRLDEHGLTRMGAPG